MIHTKCPQCGTVLKVEHHLRGHRVRCLACGKKFYAEARSWWTRMMDGKGQDKPHKHESEEKAEKRRHKGAGNPHVFRPYEKVDASVLQDIPMHRHYGTIVAVLAIVGVVAFISVYVWLKDQGKDSPASSAGAPSVARSGRTGQPPLEPAAGQGESVATPAEGDTAEEENRDEEAVAAAMVRRPPPVRRALLIPDFALEMDARIRMAGYRAQKGFSWSQSGGYCAALEGMPSVYFVAYPEKSRVVCQGFYAWKRHGERSGPDALERLDVIARILRYFLDDGHEIMLKPWLESSQEECLASLGGMERYVRERRFGTRVVRVECVTHNKLDCGVLVEVARDYKPSCEIDDQPTVRSWSDMRVGMTLAEVVAFAGNGKLETQVGSGEWGVSTYVWPGKSQVVFRNGRAVDWRSPSD